jgi:uncharacterized protein with gpF-like domain
MRRPILKPQRRQKVLKGIKPNIGIETAYRKRLESFVEKIHKSVVYFVSVGYRQHTPVLAQDASPADWLARIVKALRHRWTKKIDEAAPKLAEYFAQSVEKRSTDALKKILKDSGIAVDFKMTAAMRDILDGTVNANVALIKSIPQQYFTQIEGIVARGVTTGNDLKQITDDIQQQFKVSRKRAAFIASDQCSKANSALTAERQRSVNIRKGVWRHSFAGRHPRLSHTEMDGKEFDLSQGMWDRNANGKGKGAFVMPGFLINCKCFWSPLLPGLEDQFKDEAAKEKPGVKLLREKARARAK